MESESHSEETHQASKNRRPVRYARAKHSRKKKLVVFIIAAGASAFGTLAYLNQSADPTTWKSMRTDYENTK